MDNDHRDFDTGIADEVSGILSLLDKAYFTCHCHQRQDIADKIQNLMIEVLIIESCKIRGAAANISSPPLHSV